MKHNAQSSRNYGSVLRPIVAALLMLGGVALLARAGGPTQPAVSAASGASAPTNQAAASSPGVPRFFNYMAPPGIADDVGEPSIGCNWQSEKNFSNSMFTIPNGGRVVLFGGFSPELYRATFDDCSSPAKPNWEAKPLLTASTPRGFGDPILFTDHDTGRTFVSQLEGLTPVGSTTDITDDDGDTFMPSEGSSLPSDVDHQTIGGGPFHAGGVGPVTAYPNAVYYASQSVADARAAQSLDGGVTFGPGFPMYTINECAGLHGHIKVSPKDGTVYVPNVGCGGALPFHDVDAKQAVIVSEDNGMTWNVRPIPDSTTHGNGNEQNTRLQTRDPSVTIDAEGTVYFVYQAEGRLTEVMDPADKAGDTHPKVAVSHDKGKTWEPSIDVGANVLNGAPIRNATFVTATSGSSGRAAVAFYGTETGGNNWPCGESDDCSGDTGLFPREPFTGVWYLYISATFDGGKTWTTQNVTPGDPVQRSGICGGSTCRNLLDFTDLQIDKEGRILFAGEDGCIDACVDGPPNSFTAKGFITRQSGGNRMLAAFDPVEPALAGAPLVEGVIDAAKTKVTLTWQTPDNGGSEITKYNVFRQVGGTGQFKQIGAAQETSFVDTKFDRDAENAYRVVAVNAVGDGPYCNDVVPIVGPPLESICDTLGVTELTDPAGDTSAAAGTIPTPAGPGMDLLSLRLSQPLPTDGVARLVFRIKTDPGINPQPPGSGWYVSMKTPDGKVHGVRMAFRGPDPEFESYLARGNTNGGVDGRFAEPDSIKPAEPASHYDPDAGLIEIVVQATALGLSPGDTISGFNSAVTQTTDPLSVGPGATTTFDQMPDSLAYQGAQVLASAAGCIDNQPPVAQLTANPEQGPAPLHVMFSGAGSNDPDAGDAVSKYRFSFGDGTPEQEQAKATIEHTYKAPGTYFATLKVVDSKGLISSNVASVVIKAPATLQNISTRARVDRGDNATIGGFIIDGSAPKKVIIRGIGPSLKNGDAPFPGRLEDPTLELHNANKVIESNDNWKQHEAEVKATGIPPQNDKEAAIVRTLPPGPYTVILRGKNNGTGTGLVEVYDLDREVPSRLANLSTRGRVETAENVMIGGFMVGPPSAGPAQIVVRALGPSLGVPNTVQDPTVDVRNADGEQVAFNDNWQQTQKNAIKATGLAPDNAKESAILLPALEPGSYTAIVRGKTGVGVGLVEIYNIQ